MDDIAVFDLIKAKIIAIQQQKNKPIRVAINGIEGTGKTVFATKLTSYLYDSKLRAIHVTIDGYHNEKSVRYKQGRDAAKGYYEDAYNEIAFVEKVLKSSQTENPNYITAVHDLETDELLNLAPTSIELDSVLIVDGAYLFKKIYQHHWDLKIYLKTSFDIAMQRGIERDKIALGGYDATRAKYENRYHKASKIYVDEIQPENIADIVIDNSDFNNLIIVKK